MSNEDIKAELSAIRAEFRQCVVEMRHGFVMLRWATAAACAGGWLAWLATILLTRP